MEDGRTSLPSLPDECDLLYPYPSPIQGEPDRFNGTTGKFGANGNGFVSLNRHEYHYSDHLSTCQVEKRLLLEKGKKSHQGRLNRKLALIDKKGAVCFLNMLLHNISSKTRRGGSAGHDLSPKTLCLVFSDYPYSDIQEKLIKKDAQNELYSITDLKINMQNWSTPPPLSFPVLSPSFIWRNTGRAGNSHMDAPHTVPSPIQADTISRSELTEQNAPRRGRQAIVSGYRSQ